MANEEYIKSINKWRQEVDDNLRRENGWLALAGLFWLCKGRRFIIKKRRSRASLFDT